MTLQSCDLYTTVRAAFSGVVDKNLLQGRKEMVEKESIAKALFRSLTSF